MAATREDGAVSAAPSSRPGPLLQGTDLAISIPTESGTIEALRGISLQLSAGETIGIVGESGSGKTMLALSVLGLLPGRARVTGSVRLDGEGLLQAREGQSR